MLCSNSRFTPRTHRTPAELSKCPYVQDHAACAPSPGQLRAGLLSCLHIHLSVDAYSAGGSAGGSAGASGSAGGASASAAGSAGGASAAGSAGASAAAPTLLASYGGSSL